jgi:hypothetical protein
MRIPFFEQKSDRWFCGGFGTFVGMDPLMGFTIRAADIQCWDTKAPWPSNVKQRKMRALDRNQTVTSPVPQEARNGVHVFFPAGMIVGVGLLNGLDLFAAHRERQTSTLDAKRPYQRQE